MRKGEWQGWVWNKLTHATQCLYFSIEERYKVYLKEKSVIVMVTFFQKCLKKLLNSNISMDITGSMFLIVIYVVVIVDLKKKKI